ncbi:hypothetical protein Droror1_Dr00000670 [Drosera rotundifolia]
MTGVQEERRKRKGRVGREEEKDADQVLNQETGSRLCAGSAKLGRWWQGRRPLRLFDEKEEELKTLEFVVVWRIKSRQVRGFDQWTECMLIEDRAEADGSKVVDDEMKAKSKSLDVQSLYDEESRATTSTERLEFLDDKEHILSIRIIGGDHRLKNYSSIVSLHPMIIDGRSGTMVIESFVVDVPEGNTKDETEASKRKDKQRLAKEKTKDGISGRLNNGILFLTSVWRSWKPRGWLVAGCSFEGSFVEYLFGELVVTEEELRLKTMVASGEMMELNGLFSSGVLVDIDAVRVDSVTEGPAAAGSNVQDRAVVQAHSYWLYEVPWGFYKAISYIKEFYGNPIMILSENGIDISSFIAFQPQNQIKHTQLKIDGVQTAVLYLDTEGFESIGKSNAREADLSRLSFVVELAKEFYGSYTSSSAQLNLCSVLFCSAREFMLLKEERDVLQHELSGSTQKLAVASEQRDASLKNFEAENQKRRDLEDEIKQFSIMFAS